MPFNPVNIDPLNLSPSKGIGINIPSNGDAIFKQTFTTKEDVKASILNLFLTEQGEHYLNNNFGSGIRNFLFEQQSEGLDSRLELFITDQMALYFPQVNVEKINLTNNVDDNSISIEVLYVIINTRETDSINIFI